MKQYTTRRILLSTLTIALVSGCGETRPTTYPATGEVLYKSQPVSGAQVMFLSAEGRSASATTNEQGQFTLNTFEAGDGVLPGSHQVVITKVVAPAPTAENPYPPPKSMLPQKYADASTSQLTADVTAEGENHFRFELVD